MLVEKNPDLPNVWDKDGSLPIHRAAMGGKKEMVLYLLTITKEDAEPKPFESEPGLKFVHHLISNGMYDIALDLLQRYPKLALGDPSPMLAFTLNRSCIPKWNMLQLLAALNLLLLVSLTVPGKFEDYDQTSMNWAKIFIPGWRKLLRSVTEFAGNLVPQIRHIKRTKLLHDQAIHLVKWLCSEIVQLDSSKASSLFEKPLRLATIVGIPEVVEEIISSFSSIVRHKNELDHSVFHLAILNRRENIYNLIYQIEGLRQVLLSSPDTVKNNCLHLAGYLAPWPKLNIRESAAGAVLQLQRELQWFKEVENTTLPQDKEVENSEKKTPAMLFVESHEELVKEGEQWMKDTANSCIIVVTLIATIMFAAAITVPGGSNGDTGLANFSERKAFKIFAISDTLALFSSTTSMLMFLSILTSRYADEDFLYALPKRLIIGLVTLFLSIIFMMAAFGTIVYLVFGNDASWILEVVIGLGCLPVGLFVFLQFPLLWDMIKSTYFPSIFGKRSDRILL
ncbi:Ankyrin repeat family protein [Forsythia ovata]|uniref:Ankyrin repeat family protein n=1 Tax=Forsythia ovata TaxID=205694 RepID=A0ABD1X113_9LAMI